jgi:alanine racemase
VRDALTGPVARIDHAALRANAGAVRQAAGVGLMAVVKADAYGHGLIECARTFLAAGAEWLAVADVTEAEDLAAAGLTPPTLVLGPALPGAEDRLAATGARCTVTTTEDGGRLGEAARRAGRVIKVHFKVDTGMGRLGLAPADALPALLAAARTKGLEVEGVYTHLATADEPGSPLAARQLALFDEFLENARRAGFQPALRHAANTAAALALPRARYDLVRSGIALYGYSPAPGPIVPLTPAMTLLAPVSFVKRVRAGATLSYGASYTVPRDTSIATVRIGYADGYDRRLSNLGEVVIAGERRPVRGRVCMDQILVDVGDAPPRPGDAARIFGPGEIDAATVARWLATIPYEVVSRVGSRVRREHSSQQR